MGARWALAEDWTPRGTCGPKRNLLVVIDLPPIL